MSRHAVFATSIVVAVIAAGCSSSSGGEIVESDVSAPAGPSTSVSETTIPTVAPTVAPTSSQATAAGFSRTTDVHYLTMNGVELFMDVYTPMGEGPWPIVVAFHGLSSALKDASTNTVVAEEAAARGMVVFAPSWIAGEPFPLTIEDITMLNEAANCSVAFAQQHAPDFRGDPARTVVYGFSAGAGPALVAALEPSTAPVPGCQTAAMPDPVVGVVLGDGEYFFHSENFDGAFRADLAPMQAEVASWTDPTSWPANLNAEFYLWVAADGTAPRAFDDPSDPSGWLAPRDPTGSIRRDLDRLGALDDGIVSNIDSANLLRLRLAEAGIDAAFEEYPGGHTTLDKAAELVDHLEAAADQLRHAALWGWHSGGPGAFIVGSVPCAPRAGLGRALPQRPEGTTNANGTAWTNDGGAVGIGVVRAAVAADPCLGRSPRGSISADAAFDR